jgi:hypothetical protein
LLAARALSTVTPLVIRCAPREANQGACAADLAALMDAPLQQCLLACFGTVEVEVLCRYPAVMGAELVRAVGEEASWGAWDDRGRAGSHWLPGNLQRRHVPAHAAVAGAVVCPSHARRRPHVTT